MNRKFSQQIAGNMGYRLPTAFDQEREEFEKAQSNAMTKSLSLEEAGPKEKHVRTLVMGTYRNRGADVFWQKLTSNIPLFANEIVTWKFCVVLHRLMQDGDAKVIAGSIKHGSLIDEVCRSHSSIQKSAYGQLIGCYGKMMLGKLMFHNKNRMVPGNFSMKTVALENIDAGDMFELCVDFLDQIENTILLMKTIFNSFEKGNKSISLTKEGQCRLAALIPCTHDSTRLLELTTSLMRLLHLALPWETLEGHRSRFGLFHSQLKKIYEEMSNIIYLRSMVQIPRLSGDLSIFFETLKTMSDSNKADVPSDDFQIQTFDAAQQDELISVADSAADASMAYIQQEYSDLSSKYQMVLKMLEEEQKQRTRNQQEHENRERLLEEQLETLRQQFNEFTTASNSTADADGKLEKLKVAYQRLRTDHITALRSKGESDKNLQLLRANNDALEARSKSIDETLVNLLQSHNIDYDHDNGSGGGGGSGIASLACTAISEKLDTLQVSLLTKENALREAKVNISQELEHQASNALRSQEELKANLALLRQCWQNEISWRAQQLEEASINGGAAEIVDISAQIQAHCVQNEDLLSTDPSKSLPEWDRIVSLSLMTLNRMGSRADTGDGDGDEMSKSMQRLCQLSATIATAATAATADNSVKSEQENISDLWQLFKEEVAQQTAVANNFDIGNDVEGDVDEEIKRMQLSISEAATAMEKLMISARANETKKKDIDVDLKILDSCSSLLQAIEVLIRAARQLQAEIAGDSGSVNSKEFYQKNQKWSQGLISAAHDIGSGAKCLVEAADGVLSGRVKFEALIVASQEIAASTAQMVLASRVKAKKESEKLDRLSSSSKSVAEKTAFVVATARACASHMTERENEVDLTALSVHQSKRLEMEVQIKVLELETTLEKQRKKLFEIRKHQYAKNNNHNLDSENEKVASEATDDNP